jgi:hypothetical protein
MRRVALAVLVLIGLVSCGETPEASEADRIEIEQLLQAYLPALAEAYRTEEASAVGELAAAREVASIEKRLQDIAIEGRRLEPTFRSVSIEELQIWGYANAYVTTNEIWDIRTFASGTDTMLTEQLEERNRVKYQLKRIDGRWVVLGRFLLD